MDIDFTVSTALACYVLDSTFFGFLKGVSLEEDKPRRSVLMLILSAIASLILLAEGNLIGAGVVDFDWEHSKVIEI